MNQIKEEGFLEDVNNMLNSGEVPNIFVADEKAELCEKMRVVSIVYQGNENFVISILFYKSILNSN